MTEAELKRRVMVHEAGHAIGAWSKGWPVLGIVEHVGMDRRKFGEGEGITRYELGNATREARADVLCGGYAAEVTLLGVTDLALAEHDLGLVGRLCPTPGDRDAARRWVEARIQEALAVSKWHQSALHELIAYMGKNNGCCSRWVGETFREKHFA